MLSRLFTVFVTLFAFTQFMAAQEKKEPPPRFAIVSSVLLTDPRFGLRDLSKLDKFIAKNILPEDKETADARSDDQIYSPKRETIAQFLRILQRKNNIIFLDVFSYFQTFQLIARKQEFDITAKIVDFGNSLSEKSDGKINFKVPDGRIALIDVDRLWQNGSGVPRLVSLVREHGDQAGVCRKTSTCMEIGEAIQEFAEKNDFALIFNRSRPLPAAIRPFSLTDQTDEFQAFFMKKK